MYGIVFVLRNLGGGQKKNKQKTETIHYNVFQVFRKFDMPILHTLSSEYEKNFFAGHVRRFTPYVRRFYLKRRTYCPPHVLV